MGRNREIGRVAGKEGVKVAALETEGERVCLLCGCVGEDLL